MTELNMQHDDKITQEHMFSSCWKGKVYCQEFQCAKKAQQQVGVASYHFDAFDNIYINWTNFPHHDEEIFKLIRYNGTGMKKFTDIKFSNTTTFTAVLDFSNDLHIDETVWRYNFTLSDDYMTIKKGTVTSDKDDSCKRFNKELNYHLKRDGELKSQTDQNDETALTRCAFDGDEKTMRYLLEDLKLDIKQTDEYGRNVFHHAVVNKNHGIQMAKLINEKGGELKFQKDDNGDTALARCAFCGDDKTLRYLLDDLKLDIKQTGKYGRNVFHHAVLNKNHGIQMAKLINEKDGELKFQKDKKGETALTRCAFDGDEKTMRYLLEDLGLDIKQTGCLGQNVFHNAVVNTNYGIQMAKLINEKDGKLKFQKDDNGDTALTLCASLGDEKTMKYLLEDLELDVKQTGQYGRNVFHHAVMNKNHGIQMAKLINEKDGELKFQKDDNGLFGDTALTLCAKLGDEKTMRYLLEDLELDIKQTDKYGRNSFHKAVLNQTRGPQMAQLINKKDGKLKFQKDRNGETSLTLCAWHGDEKTMRYLLDDLKLDIKQTFSRFGRNVFHRAVMNKNNGLQVAKLINEKDGELKFQKDVYGWTPLYLCAWDGYEKTMRYLLDDLKLDIKQTGKYGRNLFHRAVMNKNDGLQIAKLINEKDGELKFQKDVHGRTALYSCKMFGDEKTMRYLVDELKLEDNK